MKSKYFKGTIGRVAMTLFFLVGIGVVSATTVQAQWPWGNNPYGRDDRYGRNSRYGNIVQVAINQGFQDGINTGARDAQRRQNYNPQRSHFYRNGRGDNGGYGSIVNSSQYRQAYRQGFLRGYDQGYRQYIGYRRNDRYNNNRWPFPW